jgi:hypothetical protein
VVGLGFGSPKSQDFLGFGVFSRTLMEADILWGFFENINGDRHTKMTILVNGINEGGHLKVLA